MKKTKHYYKLLDFTQRLEMLPLKNALTSREYEIIKYRYGLNDNIPHTLKETGREFRITRERVRQLETKVFQKIKVYLGVRF